MLHYFAVQVFSSSYHSSQCLAARRKLDSYQLFLDRVSASSTVYIRPKQILEAAEHPPPCRRSSPQSPIAPQVSELPRFPPPATKKRTLPRCCHWTGYRRPSTISAVANWAAGSDRSIRHRTRHHPRPPSVAADVEGPLPSVSAD